MGVALAARPRALLAVLYKPEYLEGAAALPVLVAGICCLSVLAVACAIINAAGRPRVSSALVAVTVGVGAALAFVLARGAEPGAPMLTAIATATSIGMAAGLVGAIAYLQRRFGAPPPVATVVRVIAAASLSVLAGRALPGSGKLAGLAAIALATVTYAAVLVVARELGPADRQKLARILGRRSRGS
jgi:O-antigen/teichoic acid export membrane protein